MGNFAPLLPVSCALTRDRTRWKIPQRARCEQNGFGLAYDFEFPKRVDVRRAASMRAPARHCSLPLLSAMFRGTRAFRGSKARRRLEQ
jgi:hypothetical protein